MYHVSSRVSMGTDLRYLVRTKGGERVRACSARPESKFGKPLFLPALFLGVMKG